MVVELKFLRHSDSFIIEILLICGYQVTYHCGWFALPDLLHIMIPGVVVCLFGCSSSDSGVCSCDCVNWQGEDLSSSCESNVFEEQSPLESTQVPTYINACT